MRNTFTVAGQSFSSFGRVLIVAEIGTAHNGGLANAEDLIKAAKEAGADAVKFQIVYADEILHQKTGFVDLPTGRIPLYDRFKSLERPLEFYAELADYAKKQGLLFAASAFGFRSADELASLEPAFIKIASPELNHFPLLRKVAGYNIPLILSTGVSRLGDIEAAVNCLEEQGLTPEQYALLHCVTAYPAPPEDYNTSLIKSLSVLFDTAAGVSDHSLDPVAVPLAALLQGACIIEKHICLSRSGIGLDDPVALEPDAFAQMVTAVREAAGKSTNEIIEYAAASGYPKDLLRTITGSGVKRLAASEKAHYGRTNRSLHYRTDLPAGTRLDTDDIAVLRTEKVLSVGESPLFFNRFIGAVLQKNVQAGAGVRFEDVMQRRDVFDV